MAKVNYKRISDWQLNESLFENTTVDQLMVEHKDCVIVEGTTIVEKALERMVARGISSLPLEDKDHKIIGILSMADIVAHISGYMVGKGEERRHFEQEKDALNFPCQDLLGLTWESKNLILFDGTERLNSVLAKLSATGAHRALVKSRGGWQVLSQWDIAVWLARHCCELDDPNLANFKREWLGSITTATLDELNLIESKHMVFIPHDMPAMEGFHQLAKYNGVSAMPVVAENGTLCGTLSTSDLRGMDQTKFKLLSLPVMEFLKTANLLQFPQVIANGRMKFGDVLIHLRARDVHRVWIINGENKPVGVLSLTDIIHKISQWLILPPPELEAPTAPAADVSVSAGKSQEKLGTAATKGQPAAAPTQPVASVKV